MISEYHFIINKNGEPNNRCYCRHPELIENYDKAMEDKTQTWDVHHRLECCFTYKFLKDMGLYYDVEPEALIFLTKSEHRKLDSANKRMSEAKKGKLINRKDRSKKVLCLETKEAFESISEAHRTTGIHIKSISNACNGKYKTAGGYHWKFVQ